MAAKKKLIWFWDKKLTMKDIFFPKKEIEEDISSKKEIEKDISIITNIEENDGWFDIIHSHVEEISKWEWYYITEEWVKKFFQFIKEKAFYQQLWPLVIINKFKDIIWYK